MSNPFAKPKPIVADQERIPETTRRLAVSLPAGRPNYAVGSDTYSIVLTGADTADAYAFIDMHVPPGGGPMPHAHGFEEMFYVVEGEVAVFCHDQRTTAGPFCAVNIPGWAPHMFKNLGTVPARLLSIVAGAGLEEEFAEIGRPVATRVTPPPPLSPAEQAKLRRQLPAIARRYQARILPLATFDHLLSANDQEIIKVAGGES